MAPGDSNPKRADVEHVVRQVLAEIAGGNSNAAAAGGELVISGRVVSLADLAGRLTGVARVVVERGAVFTPAARDELKQQGVTIASTISEKQPTATETIYLGCVETKYDAGPLTTALANDGVRVERISATNLPAMIDTLCQRTVNDGRGMLVTGLPAAGLCLANRQRGVRAALATDVAAVEAAVAAIGANLLVIDPAGKSVFELRRITRHWLRGGRPECPAALRERLQ